MPKLKRNSVLPYSMIKTFHTSIGQYRSRICCKDSGSGLPKDHSLTILALLAHGSPNLCPMRIILVK